MDAREKMIQEIADRVVRIGRFNTGRYYGPDGQLIYWAVMNDDRILFEDVSRHIHGELTIGDTLDFEIELHGPIAEWTDRDIQDQVLSYYDDYLYVYSLESDWLEKIWKQRNL